MSLEKEIKRKPEIFSLHFEGAAKKLNVPFLENKLGRTITELARLSYRIKQSSLYETLLECEECEDDDYIRAYPELMNIGFDRPARITNESGYFALTGDLEKCNEQEYIMIVSLAFVKVGRNDNDKIQMRKIPISEVDLGSGVIRTPDFLDDVEEEFAGSHPQIIYIF